MATPAAFAGRLSRPGWPHNGTLRQPLTLHSLRHARNRPQDWAPHRWTGASRQKSDGHATGLISHGLRYGGDFRASTAYGRLYSHINASRTNGLHCWRPPTGLRGTRSCHRLRRGGCHTMAWRTLRLLTLGHVYAYFYGSTVCSRSPRFPVPPFYLFCSDTVCPSLRHCLIDTQTT